MTREQPIKIILVGDSGVGKTCITQRAVCNSFSKQTSPTIAFSYLTLQIKTEQDTVFLTLWDTAGQESFRSLVPLYFKGAQGSILVFDITKRHSFLSLPEWVDLLVNNEINLSTCLLVGNKIDLQEGRAVNSVEASTFAGSHSMLGYLECSALTGEALKKFFK